MHNGVAWGMCGRRGEGELSRERWRTLFPKASHLRRDVLNRPGQRAWVSVTGILGGRRETPTRNVRNGVGKTPASSFL